MRALPFCFVVVLGSSATALADEDTFPTEEVELSTRTGSFLPFTSSPATPASTVRTSGMFDGAQNQGSLTLDAQALLTSWLQLQAAATYADGELSSRATVQLGILQDDKNGLDLQINAGYAENGFNTVPANLAGVAVGHELPGIYVATAARFELGIEQSERALVLNLGAVRAISESLYGGFDSELSFDLERAGSEPMGESSYSLHTGPVVTYAVSRVAVTASGGLSLDKPRMASREVGAFGLVGVATAF
jgi:hypothetical protein